MTFYIFVEFVLGFNGKIETDYKLILLQTKVLFITEYNNNTLMYNIYIYI